mmetsp:Transcript_7757/g.26394  ORF Transcript_7757/g.26394 Transcript_7757/m.26394 type:complete len:214 (-) Transcript_7757:65-706(-)
MRSRPSPSGTSRSRWSCTPCHRPSASARTAAVMPQFPILAVVSRALSGASCWQPDSLPSHARSCWRMASCDGAPPPSSAASSPSSSLSSPSAPSMLRPSATWSSAIFMLSSPVATPPSVSARRFHTDGSALGCAEARSSTSRAQIALSRATAALGLHPSSFRPPNERPSRARSSFRAASTGERSTPPSWRSRLALRCAACSRSMACCSAATWR